MRKKILLSCSLLFFGLLIGFYIFQLNSLTTLAWRIAETEDSLLQQKREHTALQQKTYQTVSFKDLEELAKARQFVKIHSITYVQVLDDLVAQNQPRP